MERGRRRMAERRPGEQKGCCQGCCLVLSNDFFFLLRSKLDNKVLVFHPVVYKEYSYHETYSETLTTSTGSKKMTPRGKYSHHTAKSTESRLFAAPPTDTSDPSGPRMHTPGQPHRTRLTIQNHTHAPALPRPARHPLGGSHCGAVCHTESSLLGF